MNGLQIVNLAWAGLRMERIELRIVLLTVYAGFCGLVLKRKTIFENGAKHNINTVFPQQFRKLGQKKLRKSRG